MEKNEPAFPRNYDADGHNGISLRAYIATAALQGLLAGPEVARSKLEIDSFCRTSAQYSVKLADALIAELAK